MAFLRHPGGIQQFEADQQLPWPAAPQNLQTALSHEKRLLQGHRPRGMRLEWIREAIRILAHDEVALLQTQHALRLDAERAQALRRPGSGQRAPDIRGIAGSNMNFIAKFADESDAQQPRRDTANSAAAHALIRKLRIAEIQIGQRL